VKAIAEGVSAGALAPGINAAEEIAALEAVITSHPKSSSALSRDEVAALVDQVADHLDDVFGDDADFGDLGEFLTEVGLHIVYGSQSGAAVASLDLSGEAANPHSPEAVGVNAGVRGGT
jgi:hypothetical protein